jgi:predicted dehydrogenase
MTDRLRAGVIGAGFMGAVHAHAVRAAGGEVSAVLASSAERSVAAAQQLQAGAAATSITELVERDDVDVVHVCTPNRLHPNAVREALAQGKPVICEKPLAVDLATARALAQEARAAHVVNAVPFVYRFYPTVREMRARLGGGAEVRLIHGTYLQDWLAPTDRRGWRLDDEMTGPSRAFADIGIHWCDLAEFVTGQRIKRLSARLTAANRPASATRNEDGAVVSFELSDGAIGAVVVSQVSPGHKNALQLTVSTDSESYAFAQEQPETLWFGGRSENRVLHRGGAGESAAAAAYSRLPVGHPQGYQDCFNAFVADTYRAVRGDPIDSLPTFEDGVRSAVISEAVLASADVDGWVEVDR